MKKLFSIVFIFCTITGFAQKNKKVDSIYYLLDTIKTPVNVRMWDVHEEYPSLKIYTVLCPCLLYDQQPTFVYNMKESKGIVLEKNAIKNLKLINLHSLILKSKKFTMIDFRDNYVIFIIEPISGKYICHKVRLIKPLKPREVSIDYENIPNQDSVKKP